MFALMTTREIYRDYLQKLQAIYSLHEATVITDWVFEKIAGLQRADIVRDPSQVVNDILLDQLNRCQADLLQHKPVQYVLGEAWFYKMKLKVNEQVLIPRPETEELVQLVIDHCQSLPAKYNSIPVQQPEATQHNLTMIDIGTGSGCIAIAVKKSLPDATIYAIDTSAGALSVARENTLQQQAELTFLLLDFLDQATWPLLPVFDIIISNPPYIPICEKHVLDKNVTDFEPATALFVPDNRPLLFYEKIADFGKTHLAANGKIFTEIHEDFAPGVRELFEKFYRVTIRKDLFGKERMLVAELKDG